MRTVCASVLCGAVLLLCMGSAQAGRDQAVQQCQKLKDRIEQYDQLRRKGGSGSQMDAWKRARRNLEKEFRDRKCRYYRWELK